MKILITGATGDIGKSLMNFLIKRNYDVIGLTRKKEEKFYVKGDLNNYDSLVFATKEVDVIIHLAALIKGNKKDLEKVNIKGTKNLIKACEKNKVKKIIFISSLDTKCDLEYGKSKLRGEELIKKSNLDWVILRPSLIYGKGFKKGISSLINLIKKFPIIPIIGKGKNLYKPLYIEDLNNLIKQILDKNKFNNKKYFVCGKETISMNGLIDLICSRLNKKIIKWNIPLFLVKLIGIMEFNYRNFLFDKIESNKEIKKDFNFHPTGIKEGIKKL